MTKPTGKVNPTYQLSEQERYEVSILGHMAVLTTGKGKWNWNFTKIADIYGVSRKTVTRCMERYPFTNKKETA